MKYIYTAAFKTGEDGKIFARVPDLKGCITTAEDLATAIDMITDAASVWLVVAEDEGLEIAKATPQDQMNVEADEVLSLIKVDTIRYRAATDTKAVRKNVSLPAWMASLAEKRGINCSKVLQDGLMSILDS